MHIYLAHQGTIAKLMNGITNTGSNIYAVAQGSSEQSISVVVEQDALAAVLASVHSEFLGQ
jgi:aspartokinase